jgi:predicted permease
VVSALLVRALNRATNSELGFDYARVITIDPHLYSHAYTPEMAAGYMQELESRLLQTPGVVSTALVINPPLGNRASFERAHDDVTVNVHFNEISPRFFETLGIPLVRGRDFTKQDRDVAIVTESCARALWPGKDPLQQTFKHNKRTLSIVGVAGNARLTALRNGDDALLYTPLAQNKFAPENHQIDSAVVLVRTSQPPHALLATISELAHAVDPSLSPDVQMLATTLNDRMADTRKFAAVVGGMGTLALVLAVVGLYGVVAYGVARRTREIGIRIALGATPSQLIHNMLAGFVLPLGLAIVVGLGVATGLSMVIREYLYGVSNWDPWSYAGAALVLAVTGSLAALVPARRAQKVDPMVALRCE